MDLDPFGFLGIMDIKMKLKLNKKNIKNLSLDAQVLPNEMTPDIAGASRTCTTSLTFNSATCLTQNTCNNVTTKDSRPHCAPQEDTARGAGC